MTFTEQANHAYRPLRGRLPCAVKPFWPHRASEYALHPPVTAFGLLGVLLEGLFGNRHRLPPRSSSQSFTWFSTRCSARSSGRFSQISSQAGPRCSLRHGHPSYMHLSGIPAWRSVLLTGLWHADPAHKSFRGILAWRRGHLSTLWHGDPQHNHFWGRVTWQACLEPVSNRSLTDA